MKLKNLKELEKVMDLCRAKGVPEITIDGVHMRFDDVPAPKTQTLVDKPTTDSIVTEGYDNFTDEQIATWSAS